MIEGSRQLAVTPVHPPRISVAPYARQALVVDDTCAYVVDLATGAVRGTLEVPAGCDIGWIGGGAIVVAGHRVRLVDTAGRTPTVLDLTCEAPMRLFATCESTALIGGESGCFVVEHGTAGITTRRFPARRVPSVVGSGAGQFLVALEGSDAIVEWDPASCTTRRSLRLPRPAHVRAVGGTQRAVWFVARETPSRIDVFVLVTMNQPTVHELPEPIVHVAAHPRLEVLWCLGDSGRVYVVDLEGRNPIRIVAEHVEAIGVGIVAEVAVVAARAGHPVEISTSSFAGAVAARRSSIGRAEETKRAGGVTQQADPTKWRDELVSWTRRGDAHGAPISPAIVAIGERFSLARELLPAIALGYGAHLCGEPSVPLVDIALVLGGTWEEALGRGELAAKGVMATRDSRVRLAPSICRALDELPPTTGVLIGTPGSIGLAGARVVVSTEPLPQLAERLVSRLGAILIDGDPAEARAYGAIALTRSTDVDARDAAIIVADSEVAAACLGLPGLDA